ncbi:DUF6728 family protein [Haoranjiania flava]|uniref:Uncharacterized protein n=1 Tax=Haoranjiania flava TaxID=1856322 RepID=A0AAE3ILN8_9BACT|nr:DUF6728 family protein [Haoranjiania flava]MCU7694149.1 hypothetical protein [Haoranjiania flava]
MQKIWNQILEYLFIRKRETPHNFDTRAMHWMNRVSIILFLIALLILFYRLFIRR